MIRLKRRRSEVYNGPVAPITNILPTLRHMQRLVLVISCCAAVVRADLKSGEETPQYWRAILGDICQLPSFPRATGDPHRYVECVRQSALAADRKDLGIWLLRECLPGFEFVASARRCKTIRSVKRQQELCGSNNSSMYQFCPSKSSSTEFLVEEVREAPRQCTCPNGEENCVCPSPEILEPVVIPINSEKTRRSPLLSTSPLQFSQYPSCPCPPAQPACTCVSTNTQNEKSLFLLVTVWLFLDRSLRSVCCQQLLRRLVMQLCTAPALLYDLKVV
ncbi:hypothetical protein OSTOST_18829 [Ostertagia ostertagi]